ncbi:hypothetical protein [Agriterribacter sp.]|uniref:hypothetical protein n=1 Tax=Agriterribacter sp. TaxID=2821509 RepID=UPI002C29F55A|nr:hypothetical protein [Agriterribacter sp.]HTN07288.1 hypothetical protein [Agriterribacter sp.]
MNSRIDLSSGGNAGASASGLADKTQLESIGFKVLLANATTPNQPVPSNIAMPPVLNSFKTINAFSEFINNKFNTNLTDAQVDSLYLSKCGHKPDWYTEPNTSFPAGLLLCGKNEPSSPTLTYEEVYDPSCSDSSTLVFNSGMDIYTMYKDSLNNIFDSLYTAKCLGVAALEQFTVKRNVSEYHYALYYIRPGGQPGKNHSAGRG